MKYPAIRFDCPVLWWNAYSKAFSFRVLIHFGTLPSRSQISYKLAKLGNHLRTLWCVVFGHNRNGDTCLRCLKPFWSFKHDDETGEFLICH